MSVEALAEQHLRQLPDAEKSGTEIKSLRGGSVEVLVPNRVKWPQGTCVILSVVNHTVGGWLLSRHGGKNLNIRENMLDYMISLFDDANNFSWDAAKANHIVLLCRMEQGEVKDYSQTEKN